MKDFQLQLITLSNDLLNINSNIKIKDIIDWYSIVENYDLSEEFIIKYQNELEWTYISEYQYLTEEFIEKYQDKVNWYKISQYQNLSEEFIERFKDKVNWFNIFKYQKLNEQFIEKYQDKCNWYKVFKYQKLSENFIEKYKDKVNWDIICKYQKLSNEFIKKYNLIIPESCWLYKDKEFKINKLKENNINIINNEYIIAYDLIKQNNYPLYNFKYKFEIDKKYEEYHCNCNINEEYSFGLTVYINFNNILELQKFYHNKKIMKVKINIEDIGVIINNIIRCYKFKVLEIKEE